MSRPSAWLGAILALGIGLGLGLSMGHGGRSLVAQSVGVPAANTEAATVANAAQAAGRTADDVALYGQLSKQYEQFASVNRTFELVSRAVSPSVVHIVAKKSHKRDDAQKLAFEETGSGVLVRDPTRNGSYVLTNNHVVEGAVANEIDVFLHDGRSLKPTRVWLDAKADIGVLLLPDSSLPAARLGDSDDVAVGSWVLALGSPFGLTHSVTQGIISARGRHEQELQDDGVENQDFLQTDAAINPGNSGGPLVNMKGEVIGINTAIASNGGGSEGVGFSIPINLARWIMDQLIASGKVSRGRIGVVLDDVRPEQALKLGLPRPRGATVLNVQADSPASKAGMHDGDVILRFNSVEVVDLNHLINLVSMAPIGRSAHVILWRERHELAVQVTIASKDQSIALGPDEVPKLGRDGFLRRPNRPGQPQAPKTEESQYP
ncbi:trypsin-like peptidase domain-containing protein [Isosphaeraceae bacterium EP7]